MDDAGVAGACAQVQLQSRHFTMLGDGGVTSGTEDARWADLFWHEHVESPPAASAAAGDDMLFFVRATTSALARDEGFEEVAGDAYFVRRKGSPQLSQDRLDRAIDWEATYWLNQLCNRVEYCLVVTARKSNADGPATVVSKASRKLYASPQGLQMQDNHGKSDAASHAYPMLSFQLHDHWGHTVVDNATSDVLGVELLAKGTLFGDRAVRAHLFRGALSHGKIAEQHGRVAASKWAWARAGEHMVVMRGPLGHGEAVMGVSMSGGAVTPQSWLRSWLPSGAPAIAPAFTCVVCSITLDWRDIVRQLLTPKG